MSTLMLFEDELESVTGKVSRVTYRNDESGWTVLRVTLKDGSSTTVVGVMPELFAGEEVEFKGAWVKHEKYGLQFKAETVESRSSQGPMDKETLIAYLGSGILPGVKEAMASRVVNHFGEDVLEVLDHTPERLVEVSGISQEKAEKIVEAWAEQRASRDALLFLCGLGVSARMARRIYAIYKAATVGKIKENPYRLAEDIDGIGFQKADAIARRMGIPADSPFRYEAGVIQALKDGRGKGHVYLPIPELVKAAMEDVLHTDDAIAVKAAIDRLAEPDRQQVFTPDAEDDPVYLPGMYRAETQCAALLLRMLDEPLSTLNPTNPEDRIDWPAIVDETQEGAEVQLTDQQREAVLMALAHKVSVITGGPGTGKSFTMKGVIDALVRAERDFALAAPTGRAAKRLGEATGRGASTIHRLLEYKPMGDGEVGRFNRTQDNPLDVDMVIIDEASMIDLALFRDLLEAVRPTTHLLLVGDVDQLPSVGAGDVLRDLIRSGRFPVARLGVIFRQGRESAIVANAHRVNGGHMPKLDNSAPDFRYVPAEDADTAAALVLDLVTKRLPQEMGVDPVRDVQVLVPMKKGAAGTSALNMRLQRALNPPGWDRPEYATKFYTFRVGDKVMQQSNNYELEVWNGDIGYVVRVNHQDKVLVVNIDGREIEYPFDDLNQLTLAYACTVHKSQGSEYQIVVLPVLTQHWIMLQKNLLYTGLTRAKQTVILVGSYQAIARCVKNDTPTRRYTALVQRLTSTPVTTEFSVPPVAAEM